ncbi:MAG: SLATT domain-containing protein, partial [Methanothrix sp.]|nr:SLATT domain-containing protein [Methanothrix sp.]
YSFPAIKGKTIDDKRSYLNHVDKVAELWAQDVVESYILKQDPVRRRAKFLRHLSIVFGSIGGLIPLLIGTGVSQIIVKLSVLKEVAWMQSMDWIRIGYFSLGLAAVFISYDKLFGYSSSWIRFVETSMAIKLLLAKFQYEWAASDFSAADCQMNSQLCEKKLQMIRDFVLAVLSEVKNESSKWAAEYSSNIATMEATYKQPNNIKGNGGQ